MEKSPILYISILAILKSGAAYAPITPETPNERKNQIIESGDIRIHLTTSDLAPEPSGVPQGVVVVCVDTVNTLWYSEANPDIQRSERDLAYAVFTSGSTGKPKGVLVENHAIVNHLRLLAEMYPAALGKRLLQFCTVAFDVSVFEIFFTWAMGMTLCVARKDVLLRDIESAINAFKITHLSMTPTVAALVNPDNVPSVEFLVTAGEGLNRKVFEAWTGRGLWTGYGPSETVNICTVRPNLRKEDHINTLGETFANTSTFVISQNEDDFCLLPRGAVGELCFGGAQVVGLLMAMPSVWDFILIATEYRHVDTSSSPSLPPESSPPIPHMVVFTVPVISGVSSPTGQSSLSAALTTKSRFVDTVLSWVKLPLFSCVRRLFLTLPLSQ